MHDSGEKSTLAAPLDWSETAQTIREPFMFTNIIPRQLNSID